MENTFNFTAFVDSEEQYNQLKEIGTKNGIYIESSLDESDDDTHIGWVEFYGLKRELIYLILNTIK